MLLNSTDPAEKRVRLRHAIASGQIMKVAGAYSALVAMAVEEAGFDGVYVGSSTLSTEIGLPDIGLITQTEASERGGQIARMTGLPTLIDADTGYGEAVNVARTIVELEARGLAGCHIEDQVNPKRCGHLDDKLLVGDGEMVVKIRAARQARRDPNFLIIARTDARGVEGMAAAIRRGRAYAEAGADMIFPEALATPEEFAAYREAVAVPLLANMTEFGKSPLLGAEELEQLGYNLVIYPVTSLRLAMKGVEEGLRTLLERGTQQSLLDSMQTRQQLYELLQYEAYSKFDQEIYNFRNTLAD